MPNFVDEPGLFAHFLMFILEWIDSKRRKTLTFGEMFTVFEEESRLEKRMMDRGFVFTYA